MPHGTAKKFGLVGSKGQVIGEWQGEKVWLICESRAESMLSVRQLIDEEVGLFQLAGRGVQLAEFYRSHRWCGYCGHEMHRSKLEFACLCSHCRERYYPQIAPCIIVAIRRGEEILLANHARHRNNVYTVLAGFVEVGETLEQAVAREVMEESNVRVKMYAMWLLNPGLFRSRSWWLLWRNMTVANCNMMARSCWMPPGSAMTRCQYYRRLALWRAV